MQLRGAVASHVGNVRETNQDRAHFGGFVAAVADGMGGHQGGETAASIAINEFLQVVDPVAPGGLVEIVEDANRAVFERASDPSLRGMGTTLVALTLRPSEQKISVVNVGDSRAYFVRGGEMGQLTVDHSLVEDLVRQNRLTPDEAMTHPQRNILTRALGIASEVEVDRFLVPTRIGDRFLLCSDGLFTEINEDEILDIMNRFLEPNEAADALVEAALRGAARDNVTVAVVDVVEDGLGGDVSSAEPQTLQMPSYEPKEPATATAPAGSPGPGEVAAPAAGDLASGGGGQASAGATGAPTATATAVGVVDPDPQLTDTQPILAADDVLHEPVAEPAAERRRSRLAPLLFIVGFVALVIAGAYYGLGAWARQTWFIDTVSAEDDQLVLVNGRPGGFWVLGGGEPEPVDDARLVELDEEGRAAVTEEQTFDSRAEAEDHIERHRVASTDDVTDPAVDPDADGDDSTTTTVSEAPPDEEPVDDEVLDELTDNAPVPESTTSTQAPGN